MRDLKENMIGPLLFLIPYIVRLYCLTYLLSTRLLLLRILII